MEEQAAAAAAAAKQAQQEQDKTLEKPDIQRLREAANQGDIGALFDLALDLLRGGHSKQARKRRKDGQC